ncbi:MAG: NADH-quinone oxidoreductase subunit H, partial [Bryobacteraceae bacterium]|nr:NADH-quinone oxidoreductase subunit H [Bryobacteraceae bacterium]
PTTGALAWMVYLPTVVLGGGGALLLVDGVRHHRGLARGVLALLGALLGGAAWAVAQPEIRPLVQGPFWFLTKVFLLLFLYVWIRGTLPRFRYDKLMAFGWKVLLPVATLNALLTALVVLLRESGSLAGGLR